MLRKDAFSNDQITDLHEHYHRVADLQAAYPGSFHIKVIITECMEDILHIRSNTRNLVRFKTGWFRFVILNPS